MTGAHDVDENCTDAEAAHGASDGEGERVVLLLPLKVADVKALTCQRWMWRGLSGVEEVNNANGVKKTTGW